MGVGVYVYVFLCMLHSKDKNIHFTCKNRAFLEMRIYLLVLTTSKDRVKTWVSFKG